MASPEHLALLKQGVEAWNEWCWDNPDIKPDLGWVDLSGADLSRADLNEVELQETKFSNLNLAEVKDSRLPTSQ